MNPRKKKWPHGRFWHQDLGGERRYVKRCLRCPYDCKVSIPVHQEEEALTIKIECRCTGFHYQQGVTNAPENKLDFLGADAL